MVGRPRCPPAGNSAFRTRSHPRLRLAWDDDALRRARYPERRGAHAMQAAASPPRVRVSAARRCQCAGALRRPPRARQLRHPKHARVKAWLAHRPRFHLHLTPTDVSWFNQMERWFGLVTSALSGVGRSGRCVSSSNASTHLSIATMPRSVPLSGLQRPICPFGLQRPTRFLRSIRAELNDFQKQFTGRGTGSPNTQGSIGLPIDPCARWLA